MSKFANIYLQAIKKKSLRDEIPVEEILPKVVRDELESSRLHQETLANLKQKDKLAAKARLELIKKQILADSGSR